MRKIDYVDVITFIRSADFSLLQLFLSDGCVDTYKQNRRSKYSVVFVYSYNALFSNMSPLTFFLLCCHCLAMEMTLKEQLKTVCWRKLRNDADFTDGKRIPHCSISICVRLNHDTDYNTAT